MTKSWRAAADSDGEEDHEHENVDSGHIEMLWGTDTKSIWIHQLVYRSSLYATWINASILLVCLDQARGLALDVIPAPWDTAIYQVLPLTAFYLDVTLKVFTLFHCLSQHTPRFTELFVCHLY